MDVGIQQSGVEHVATDEMSAATFDEVCMMLPADEEATLRAAYDETDAGTYRLNEQGRREQANSTAWWRCRSWSRTMPTASPNSTSPR